MRYRMYTYMERILCNIWGTKRIYRNTLTRGHVANEIKMRNNERKEKYMFRIAYKCMVAKVKDRAWIVRLILPWQCVWPSVRQTIFIFSRRNKENQFNVPGNEMENKHKDGCVFLLSMREKVDYMVELWFLWYTGMNEKRIAKLLRTGGILKSVLVITPYKICFLMQLWLCVFPLWWTIMLPLKFHTLWAFNLCFAYLFAYYFFQKYPASHVLSPIRHKQ